MPTPVKFPLEPGETLEAYIGRLRLIAAPLAILEQRARRLNRSAQVAAHAAERARTAVRILERYDVLLLHERLGSEEAPAGPEQREEAPAAPEEPTEQPPTDPSPAEQPTEQPPEPAQLVPVPEAPDTPAPGRVRSRAPLTERTLLVRLRKHVRNAPDSTPAQLADLLGVPEAAVHGALPDLHLGPPRAEPRPPPPPAILPPIPDDLDASERHLYDVLRRANDGLSDRLLAARLGWTPFALVRRTLQDLLQREYLTCQGERWRVNL